MADEITEEIARRRGFLKIILKTKNDDFFLEDWIKHHAKIVGIENLIIADNGSDCETVLQLYQAYGKDLLSFSFSGNHNLIHSMHHYQKLYEALSKSTTLRLFLDTDERLVWMDSDAWRDGEEVLYRIKAAQIDGVMPTGLLSNLLGSATEFEFLGEFQQQSTWLWGKAIVPSCIDDRFAKDDHIERLHNCQFEHDTFCSEFSANLHVLHLLYLDKQQRLKMNKAKLINFGIAKDEDSYETLAAKEGDYGPPTRFIQEIKSLLDWDGNLRHYDELPESAIRLLPSHEIEFSNSRSKSEFSDFIASGDRKIREILGLSSAAIPCTASASFDCSRSRFSLDFPMHEATLHGYLDGVSNEFGGRDGKMSQERSDRLVPEAHELIDGTATQQAFIEIGEAFVHHFLIGRCHLKPQQSVLDIGSGNGQKARPLTRYLAPTGSYHGFDIVKEAIDWCKERYALWPNFRFDYANLKSDWYNADAIETAESYVFPCDAGSIDVALMSSVATHLLPEALGNYLRESYRVLKPGGRLLVTFFIMSDERRGAEHPPVQSRAFERIAWNLWSIDPKQPSHGVAYHEIFARGLFADAGFDVAEMTLGTWSGSQDVLGAYQDTILAVKPTAPAA